MSRRLPAGPYLVLGAARAGRAAEAALIDESVSVWDDRLGSWSDALLDGVATVVKSPGVPMDHPALCAARRRGLRICDELEIGVRRTRRTLLAVTGTDGKSTVSALLAAALGHPGPPALVAGNTAFGPPLSAAPPTGGPVVVETSSYQLEGCDGPFAALAVLTNLTPEHLHRHRTFGRYAAAKRRLFATDGRSVGLAVLPAEGAFARTLTAELRATGSRVATFGAAEHADYRIVGGRWDAHGGSTAVRPPDGSELLLRTHLPGPHNAENVAAALAACDLYGIPRDRAVPAIERMPGVPGRWENVIVGQDFAVVIDFAHTPAGLTRALETARTVARDVHLVLSSGGGNDAGYRPRLGAIAGRLADSVIVTEGNGRGEPRERVIAAIRAGATGPTPLEAIPERRAAIAAAIARARPGDIVLIVDRGATPRLLSDRAGNGPEFDDRTVAREELAALSATGVA